MSHEDFLAAHEAAVAERLMAEQYGEVVSLLAQADSAARAALSLAKQLYVEPSTERRGLERQTRRALHKLKRAQQFVRELERLRNGLQAAAAAAAE
jgi:methylphosphotriester-DNA--protein-cysteine methyltransferase